MTALPGTGASRRKSSAHRQVTAAVADGRLVRPDACEKCGSSTADLHAHHEDYDRPLDVIWLCRSCHLHAHSREHASTPRPADDQRPTLAQIRRWPASVNVAQGAEALGVSRSALYQAIADGTSPVETIMVGQRIKVLTSSLVSVLEGNPSKAAAS